MSSSKAVSAFFLVFKSALLECVLEIKYQGPSNGIWEPFLLIFSLQCIVGYIYYFIVIDINVLWNNIMSSIFF